ncbi:MAG TPA: class I SAM-dependent methyltransferase [Candidatus Binatia bacterium]
MGSIYKYWVALKRVTLGPVAVIFVIGAIHFPYDVDAPLTQQEGEAARKYYTEAYQKPATDNGPTSEYETKYIRVAEAAAQTFRIEEQVTAFVKRFNLGDRPVLEIGSGRGYLKDIAYNYTGLDISPTVARFYHKKFVLGSATAMPFPDDSFDGVWSIWVFEHVPNPEQAFFEARRVTRDGGVLFLLPAWNCSPWAAEGYAVRPYSDFNLVGKMIKASIPLRSPLQIMALIPNRMVRALVARFGPTRLRYHRLTPNYEKYWMEDSDAVNSIDRDEAMLWFRSRGDECLNCEGASVFMASTPLIIRVHKSNA